MSEVQLVRDIYLLVKYGPYYDISIDVITRDIGCTIGTELLWGYSNERIAAYRPGTRYAAYAEELAGDLVAEVLKTIPSGLELFGFMDALGKGIRSHPDVADNPWNPDETGEGPW